MIEKLTDQEVRNCLTAIFDLMTAEPDWSSDTLGEIGTIFGNFGITFPDPNEDEVPPQPERPPLPTRAERLCNLYRDCTWVGENVKKESPVQPEEEWVRTRRTVHALMDEHSREGLGVEVLLPQHSLTTAMYLVYWHVWYEFHRQQWQTARCALTDSKLRHCAIGSLCNEDTKARQTFGGLGYVLDKDWLQPSLLIWLDVASDEDAKTLLWFMGDLLVVHDGAGAGSLRADMDAFAKRHLIPCIRMDFGAMYGIGPESLQKVLKP